MFPFDCICQYCSDRRKGLRTDVISVEIREDIENRIRCEHGIPYPGIKNPRYPAFPPSKKWCPRCPSLKLEFIGVQRFPDGQATGLWNIVSEGHPLNGSTRSEEGLRECGIEPPEYKK